MSFRTALAVRILQLTGDRGPTIDDSRGHQCRRHTVLPSRSNGFALGGAGENSQHFLFAHDDEILAVELDFGAAVLAKQDAVALFHVERTNLAFFVDLALAGGDNFALLRLLFCRVGDNDSATRGLAFFNATDQDAVVQWGEFRSHFRLLSEVL